METFAKNIQLITIMFFQLLHKTDAVNMSLCESLVTGDNGKQFCFLGSRIVLQRIIVLRESIVSFTDICIAQKPRKNRWGEPHIRMFGFYLAGANHSKLTGIASWINEHRTWLSGKKDGVFLCHIHSLFLSQSLALHHPKVRVFHFLVHIETITSIERHHTMSLCLPMEYRT